MYYLRSQKQGRVGRRMEILSRCIYVVIYLILLQWCVRYLSWIVDNLKL